MLEPGAPDPEVAADPVQVIVFNDGDRSVGVVVDQILDVAEEVVTVRQKSARKGLLGSGVVGKRVTDFLDLNQVINAATEAWFQGAGGPANGQEHPGRGSLGVLARPDPQRPGHGGLPGRGGRE